MDQYLSDYAKENWKKYFQCSVCSRVAKFKDFEEDEFGNEVCPHCNDLWGSLSKVELKPLNEYPMVKLIIGKTKNFQEIKIGFTQIKFPTIQPIQTIGNNIEQAIQTLEKALYELRQMAQNETMNKTEKENNNE